MPSSNKVRKVTSENYPTDAGREGEAIFRRVYALAGSKLPIKRLWISSMEDAAIQQGFENLRDGAAYDNLFAASECRAKAAFLAMSTVARFQEFLGSLYLKVVITLSIISIIIYFAWVLLNNWNRRKPTRKIRRR